MRNCHAIVMSHATAEASLAELLKMRADYPNRFITRFELFSDTKKYYLHGMDHSIDIVRSIKTRFETGSSHSGAFFVRSILGETNEV